MTLTLRYSIVNIQIFRLGGIRSHMIGNLDLKIKLAGDIIIPTNQNQLINAGARAMTKFFLKITSYFDFELSNLKVTLA